MILKIDLHVHTWYSDSIGTIDEIIENAQKKGLDGLAITDHNTIDGVKEAITKAKNLVIIPGQEVNTKQGEILALGIGKRIPRDLQIFKAIDRIHRQGGIAVIPHPTVPFFHKLRQATLCCLPIDAIEVFSAATPFACHFLRVNLSLARNLGAPITGGSDSHLPKTVGDAYTLIRTYETNVSSILQSIKKGHTTIGGNPSNWVLRTSMYTRGLLHFIKRSVGMEDEEFSYRSMFAVPRRKVAKCRAS